MKFHKYKILEKLSEGSQGEVYKIEDNQKQVLALKIIKLAIYSEKDKKEFIELFKNEFLLLKSLYHENIVKVFDFEVVDEEKLFFTMEYYNGCNLLEFFNNHENYKYLDNIISQTLSALNYIHSNDVIHFDIKPENILIKKVKDKYKVKIIDFGLADKNYKHDNYPKGTMLFMAPELLNPLKVNKSKADIYSFGISLGYSLLTDFERNELRNMLKQHSFKENSKIVKNYILKMLSKKYDLRYLYFIKKMLSSDPALRTSAKEALYQFNSFSEKSGKYAKSGNEHSLIKNSKFIIREKSLAEVIGYYQEFTEKKTNFIISLIGEEGSGKSRLLQEFKNYSAVQELTISLSLKSRNEPFSSLKQIVEHFLKYIDDKKLKEKVLSRLSGFNLQGLDLKTPDSDSLNIEAVSELLTDLNLAFPREKIVLLIDDYNNIDILSKKIIINWLQNVQKNNKTKIFAFLTARETVIDSQNYKGEVVKEIFLEKISKDQIRLIVKYYLHEILDLPTDFYESVDFATRGNFKKIIFFLELLKRRKIIVSISDYYVFHSKGEFSQLRSSYVNSTYESIIKSLTTESKQLISIFSLLFEPVSYDDLELLFKHRLKYLLEELISYNLINCSDNYYFLSDDSLRWKLIPELFNKTILKQSLEVLKDSISFKNITYLELYTIISNYQQGKKQYYNLIKVILDLTRNNHEIEISTIFTFLKLIMAENKLLYEVAACELEFYSMRDHRHESVKYLKKFITDYDLEKLKIDPVVYYNLLKHQITLSYDHNESLRAVKILIREIDLFYKYLAKNNFYTMIVLAFQELLRTNTELLKEYLKIIDPYLKTDDEESIKHNIILTAMKIIFEITPFNQNKFLRIERYLKGFAKKKTSSSSIGTIIRYYVIISKKQNLKIGDFVLELCDKTYEYSKKQAEFYNVLHVLKTKLMYYFYIKNYQKSYNTMLEIKEETESIFLKLPVDFYANIARVKSELMHNTAEIEYFYNFGINLITKDQSLNRMLALNYFARGSFFFFTGNLAKAENDLKNGFSNIKYMIKNYIFSAYPLDYLLLCILVSKKSFTKYLTDFSLNEMITADTKEKVQRDFDQAYALLFKGEVKEFSKRNSSLSLEYFLTELNKKLSGDSQNLTEIKIDDSYKNKDNKFLFLEYQLYLFALDEKNVKFQFLFKFLTSVLKSGYYLKLFFYLSFLFEFTSDKVYQKKIYKLGQETLFNIKNSSSEKIYLRLKKTTMYKRFLEKKKELKKS